jgi:hypothetical protein
LSTNIKILPLSLSLITCGLECRCHEIYRINRKYVQYVYLKTNVSNKLDSNSYLMILILYHIITNVYLGMEGVVIIKLRGPYGCKLAAKNTRLKSEPSLLLQTEKYYSPLFKRGLIPVQASRQNRKTQKENRVFS